MDVAGYSPSKDLWYKDFWFRFLLWIGWFPKAGNFIDYKEVDPNKFFNVNDFQHLFKSKKNLWLDIEHYNGKRIIWVYEDTERTILLLKMEEDLSDKNDRKESFDYIFGLSKNEEGAGDGE